MPALVAIAAASTLVIMPPRPTPAPPVPPMRTPARSAGPRTSVIIVVPCARRRPVVQAVDVGQQDERVGLHDVRHQRGEPVVVAEADLVGGDGVVLVDDRHDAEVEQPEERALRVAVVAAPDDVVGGHQHLPDGEAVLGERAAVLGDEDPLADRRGCLLRREVARTSLQAQAEGSRWRWRRWRRAPPGARPCGAPRSARRGRRCARRRDRHRTLVSDDDPTLTTMRGADAMRARTAEDVMSRLRGGPRPTPPAARRCRAARHAVPRRPGGSGGSRRRPRRRRRS